MKINPATVLIVEDHQDLAANIGDFLEAGGMTVDFAADGISALQLYSFAASIILIPSCWIS